MGGDGKTMAFDLEEEVTVETFTTPNLCGIEVNSFHFSVLFVTF